ncbi:MAG: hypothetical protein ACFFCS_13595 [Candidatus Hodarchaeota archaeon]
MAKKKSSRSSGLYQYKHAGVIKVLVIVGAIVGIILAVYYPFRPALSFNIFPVNVEKMLWLITWGVVHVIICIALLASVGVVKTKKKMRFRLDWWVLLIISLVIILPTGNWGGLFVLIAAVIGIVDKV